MTTAMVGMAERNLQRDSADRDERRKRLLYEFNLLPATYADSSWVDAVCAANAIEFHSDHAGCIDQSTALLQHHGLCEKFDWSVRSASVRLALLQRTAFQRVCTALGLMCVGPETRRTINGETLRSLDATYGDLTDAIWAPESLVLARLGVTHHPMQYAENDRLEQARLAGYKAYKAMLFAESKAAPESISRALFRLPMAVAAEPVTPANAAVGNGVTRLVCRSVVKRWEPSWAWLF